MSNILKYIFLIFPYTYLIFFFLSIQFQVDDGRCLAKVWVNEPCLNCRSIDTSAGIIIFMMWYFFQLGVGNSELCCDFLRVVRWRLILTNEGRKKCGKNSFYFRSSPPTFFMSCWIRNGKVGVQKKSSKLSRGYFLHMLPHSNNIVATHQTHPCFQSKKFGEL